MTGTSSRGRSQERPGDGGARGRARGVKITPEPPEEQRRRAPSRPGRRPNEAGASARAGGQGGWYRGARRHPARVVPPAAATYDRRDRTPLTSHGVPPDARPGGPARARARGARPLAGAGRVRPHRSPQTADGPLWTFYEGPPTANGKPGTHHVEARVFKDLFPRFKTMKGFHVPRRAGWDCHGLPVELEVEKRLGFTRGKQDIEDYGVAEFNARCRESVQEHVGEFSRLTERMGYWVDLDAGLLDDERRRTSRASGGRSSRSSTRACWSRTTASRRTARAAAPACPTTRSRRATTSVTDPSVLRALPRARRAAGRARRSAARLDDDAVDADLQHRGRRAPRRHLRRRPRRRTRRGPRRRGAAADEGVRRRRRSQRAAELSGHGARAHDATQRPFDLVDIPESALRRASPTTSPSRTAPGWCTSPRRSAPTTSRSRAATACRSSTRSSLDGHFADDLPLVGGMFFKAADPVIVDDLRERGLLLRAENYVHSYPHCWRCDTALIYYALPSWYIRTTERKDAAARGERAHRLAPGRRSSTAATATGSTTTSTGRCRATATGARRCRSGAATDGHLTCVGSLAELSSHAGRDLTDLDPHRPYVDEITFACHRTAAATTATRVPEVIDCWYDAGSMPFAQWGYPHRNADGVRARLSRRSSSARRSTRRAAGSTR